MRWQIYTALRDRIVAAHPRDQQAHLSACLDKLMADVQRNLESKNRDKFTQVSPMQHSAHVPDCNLTPSQSQAMLCEGYINTSQEQEIHAP
jgi:hypothetical protein